MIDVDYCRHMARYNGWMNDKLYEVVAGLDDDERKRDRGTFFKSVHGTLNHLIFGDQVWLDRFTGQPSRGWPADIELFADFAPLRVRRRELDAEIAAWVETLTPEWLAADFSYRSAFYGELTRPAWVLVTHLFNHQTHHRGQLTALLAQAGLDPGVTDLPAMPGPPSPA